jgi:3-oxoacyl-[acyl-carrier protein] reductase
MIDTGLADKVVLVTGANHGIGAATAKAFAAQGAAVFVHYWRLKGAAPDTSAVESDSAPGEALHRARQALSADWVIREIGAAGGRAVAWEADLSDLPAIPELFDRAERAFGAVDVLVNNAAHGEADTFLPQDQGGNGEQGDSGSQVWTISAETHDRHFAVNSRAVALAMTEYARRHVARGARWGRIVNLSTDGASGFDGEVSYGASKHALESYSRAAAGELGRYGITVNVLSPGPVQTGYITPEVEGRVIHEIPLGRVGQPEDVADVIVFLASEQARWMTGQLLYVGGGHVMPL